MIYRQEVFAALSTLTEEFQRARPFPHIVIDNLFDEATLRRVADAFYPAEDPRWHRFADPRRETKLASTSEMHLPLVVQQFIRELNAEQFLTQLGALTNIPGLIPDPYLLGAGMHMILPGGKLAIHADFNRHPTMNVDRRLNLLVYLNEDWEESYGGHLELWDRAMRTCERRMLPVFNRTVLFLTDDFSFHGHPEPLTCPAHRVRKSIAMYYYTNGRPAHEIRAPGEHNTLFQDRPQDREEQPLPFLSPPPQPQMESVAVASPPLKPQESWTTIIRRWFAKR
ncbi:MAG: 2OG-Fe(II) oxygenase [Deltaproteobacteria bacterium]|nr:2OG-Fe(II) oxygenase [Deltaproteobacteria bacterium]